MVIIRSIKRSISDFFRVILAPQELWDDLDLLATL